MRPQLLPNVVTLGNAFCGLLALSKGIDALAIAPVDDALFYRKLETACGLIFLGLVFDGLDGWVARLTKGESAFGAQLDSFADALTFGVAPALLVKVLVEHETTSGSAWGSQRLHFLAAAAFALLAILRLVRFNLSGEKPVDAGERPFFRGLPSPAAAGSVASAIWMYLILQRPELEQADGTPTPLGGALGVIDGLLPAGALDWWPSLLVMALPALGLLMVSRVRFVHLGYLLADVRRPFVALVAVVLVTCAILVAPVPALFLGFQAYVAWGVLRWAAPALRVRLERRAAP